MTIFFKYPEKSFLPEVFAYKRFFEKMGVQVISNLSGLTEEPDVCWEFMGLDITRSVSATVYIHEYSSTSTPPFKKLKDRLKKSLNRKPDYRLFLNAYVNESFNFHDEIPFGYRDMGIEIISAKDFLMSGRKIYDFIYTGSLEKQRKIDILLKNFTDGSMREKKILILSKAYTTWQQLYRGCTNITFTGPCHPTEIPEYLMSAHFGINYIPDIEPFNQQTSTKLLEYAASGLPIITTDYHWVRAFEKKYGGSFFYLKKDFSNFTMEELNAFDFNQPDVSGWEWEKQIRNSGVLQFLNKKFPGSLSRGQNPF